LSTSFGPLHCENQFTIDSPNAGFKQTMMKKFTMYVLTLFMLFSIAPFQTLMSAEPNAISKERNKKVASEEAKILLARIDTIKDMDKSEMTRSQKKELRKEVRTIKANLADLGQGVYLSAGAIIIILLVLILLL
jgi:cell division protein FtsB